MQRLRDARVSLMLIGLTLLAGCPSHNQKSRSAEGGIRYFVRFAAAARSPGRDPNGGAIVEISTNLPDGTLAVVERGSVGMTSSGFECCPAFSEGGLQYHVPGDCNGFAGVKQNTEFQLKIIVAPDTTKAPTIGFQECLRPAGNCSNPQPKDVLDLLGPNFERLRGDQVTTVNGLRALVATAHFIWPSDTCTVPLHSGDRLPAHCGPGSMTIDEEDYRKVANGPIGALDQLRLCELWNYGTAGFKRSHPWVGFRDQIRSWVYAHLPLVSPDSPYDHFITSEVTRISSRRVSSHHRVPAWIEARYRYRGRVVGHARFVAHQFPGADTIPRWDMSEFVLD